MQRPEHLSCINTPEGIRRINEDQAIYDANPARWERRERARKERQKDEHRQEYE